MKKLIINSLLSLGVAALLAAVFTFTHETHPEYTLFKDKGSQPSYFVRAETTFTPTPTPTLSKKYKQGRRGLAILALLNKNFPTAEAYKVLRESDRPAFSFLYGQRAFGSDPKNYYELMSMFLEENRRVHVEIYTLCGACRPPRISNMNLASFCRQKNVQELQKAFLTKPKVRRKYKRWVNKIKEKFVDPYPEMTFTITISLEDNDYNKWDVVGKKANILSKSFKGYKNVNLARNAVGELPIGINKFKREIHTTTTNHLSLLFSEDIVSFDGDYFNFPGEDATKNPGYRGNRNDSVPSFKNIKNLIKTARKRKIDVYVWRPEFQGLDTKTRQHPSKRNYRIVNKKYLKQLMKVK